MKLEKPEAIKNFDRIWDKASNILKALVYFASDKGKNKLPTIEEFVLSEVVAATAEYLSGKKDYSGYFRRLENGKHCLDNNNWQIKTCQLVENLFPRYAGKFSLIFFKALQGLVTLKHQYSHGDKWWDCWLYSFYKSHTQCNPMISTFSLSVEFIDHVESRILPLFNQKEIEHIQAIASLMKKYIQEDIKFINKQYNW